jgi:hypothetical protein
MKQKAIAPYYSQGMRFLAHAPFVDRSATATQLLT